jgi:hypothetical protein
MRQIAANSGVLRRISAFCGELRKYHHGELRKYRHFTANCGKLQRIASICGELCGLRRFGRKLQHFGAFCGELRCFAVF